MPAAQLIFVRGVMATLLVLAVAKATGATRRIREIARGWVAVRAVVDSIATMLFLVSLFHLPLANATAINMASPLLITVLAALFLGERLGASRWVAIGIGFAGRAARSSSRRPKASTATRWSACSRPCCSPCAIS